MSFQDRTKNKEVNLDLHTFISTPSKHRIHCYVKGNPNNSIPVIIVHGGPGSSISKASLDVFDTKKFLLYEFDQRSCGKSYPKYQNQDNNTSELVEDIERIRKHFNLDKVVLFGGSWETTLALLYAIKYPQNVSTLLLRGVFLARQEDVDYLYKPNGASQFYPDKFHEFNKAVWYYPGQNVLEKYHYAWLKMQKIQNPNKRFFSLAKLAKKFTDWENALVSIKTSENIDDNSNATKNARIDMMFNQLHYFLNNSFLKYDNYILAKTYKIKNIKTYIVHGRQDVDTRPVGAYLLARKLKKCKLAFIDAAAHSVKEDGIFKKLKEYSEEIYNDLISEK
ncbi:proline iminopeptidase [Mycoplasmopsis mustelae]|uniref:Proline iminopeptidase n=1 Tax=Mycoplasmopsis mustelae TaxID=171289 RepID=A0A4R7UFF6_9BACT|nr:alpha/beta fold hydrolase [Mycoplasmopsis mustelae]TDV24424.1 proline iminopeptidase [Mycoplasmopsis mustelae]